MHLAKAGWPRGMATLAEPRPCMSCCIDMAPGGVAPSCGCYDEATGCRTPRRLWRDAEQLGGGLAQHRPALLVGKAWGVEDVIDRFILPRYRVVRADHQLAHAHLGGEMPQRFGGEHQRVVIHHAQVLG